MSNMIPIALIVSIEMVKFFQNLFLESDITLYDSKQNIPAKVLSMSIVEELGIVDYIFTDKTGTLTTNIMEFVGCSIGKLVYYNNPIDQKSSSLTDTLMTQKQTRLSTPFIHQN